MRSGRDCVGPEVPAVSYKLYSRASKETRLITFTVCNDEARAVAWLLLDGPGPGVLPNIGRGVVLEFMLGKHLQSWWLWADRKEQNQAVLQSAGLRSPEMVVIGQSGVGMLTSWVGLAVT